MPTAVRDTIAALIDQLFGVPADALTEEVTLADGLQLDSLSVVELQMAIEDQFGVRLDEDRGDAGQEPADITTFGELVTAVQQAVEDTSADEEARSA